MFVRDVVADVIAVVEHPQVYGAAQLTRDSLRIVRRNHAIQTPHNHQRRRGHSLEDTLQREWLQALQRIGA